MFSCWILTNMYFLLYSSLCFTVWIYWLTTFNYRELWSKFFFHQIVWDATKVFSSVGAFYSLSNYFDTKNKESFLMTDHNLTICFTHNSVLSNIEGYLPDIDTHRFRFHFFGAKIGRWHYLYGMWHTKLISNWNMSLLYIL